jgi:hypothetical protein
VRIAAGQIVVKETLWFCAMGARALSINFVTSPLLKPQLFQWARLDIAPSAAHAKVSECSDCKVQRRRRKRRRVVEDEDEEVHVPVEGTSPESSEDEVDDEEEEDAEEAKVCPQPPVVPNTQPATRSRR